MTDTKARSDDTAPSPDKKPVRQLSDADFMAKLLRSAATPRATDATLLNKAFEKKR